MKTPSPFSWSVTGGMEALSPLAGVRFDRLFREHDAVVEAWTKGLPLARQNLWPEVSFGNPHWANISYGHINTLGSRLIFPEDSEVAHTPIYSSLTQGIAALEKEVDFTASGLFPYYLDLWEQLKKTFSGMPLPFEGFGLEGPVTTAWLLRGHDFFMDIYDHPADAALYLERVTDSIIRYRNTLRALNGQKPVPGGGIYICDDGAAMIPPSLWPQFVLPYLNQCYGDAGWRGLHLEDMTSDHLPYLVELRISSYDPSVSRKLTPSLILKHAPGVPFSWRLNEMECANLTTEQTARWVLDAAVEGAPGVNTGVWRNTVTPQAFANFHMFKATAQQIETMLARGCPRSDLVKEIGTAHGS
jgi:hypothetical protein